MNKAIERGQSFLDKVAGVIRNRNTEGTASVNSQNDDWPEPGDIKGKLHPVPSFEAETLLPPVLREWVMDEADRMPCPPDFVAAAAVVALGSIIGARCAIKPKAQDDWLVVPNVWGGVVGLPSAKKSPAISAALKPLERLIEQAIEAHRAELDACDASRTVFKAREDAIEHHIKAAAKDPKNGDLDSLVQELQDHRQQVPDSPALRRYKTNDTTIEKLGELLRDNPGGLLLLRDELVGLLSSWERYGREGERAFYLEAWNGNSSFDTDRIGRGSIFIPNLCVSIFGGIQPDKLTAYLEQIKNALANDGMLQRFQLLVYPDHRKWEWRDRAPNMEARNQAFAIFEALAEFNPVDWGAAPADEFIKFPHFHFDEAAQELFIKWSSDLHTERLPAEEDSLMAQHLAKFDKLFPALALIFHLVECAATGRRGPLSKEAALRAAAWCEYLEAHARRCYGLLADMELCAAQALAKKLLQGDLVNGFTVRDVMRKQWSGLKTKPVIQAGLAWLEEEEWLRSEDIGASGRSTRRYWINPRISELGKTGKHDDELA
ncbi:putative DNA primase/helicase [Nitrosospira multiformis]|uniref:Putative DNA primase/helicase n=1 Tax=Nitrosospira multiformis TaxID=1231 RepID=A0A1H8KEV8_9PROT|nr:YfjI family protein [Nitrosospira multiformis]SEN91490.1 putative DNA primase/helicase [Nitrosospira multiformis]